MRTLFKVCSSLLLAMTSLVLLAPRAAHADGGAPNLAYVAGTSHGISMIDVAQQEVTSTFAADSDPRTILLSLDARFLYVTEPALNRVAILAAKSGQTICTANVPGQPSLLALDPGTNTLYAAGNEAASVSALDTTNCTIKQTLKTAGNVYGLAVAIVGSGPSGGNGNQIWASDATSVTIFDSAGKQLTSIPVEGGPQYITIPTGFVAYVTTRSGNVDAIDLQTRSVLPPLLKGQAFGPMDYDAITGEVYVPDIDGNRLDVLAPAVPGSSNPQHQPIRMINLGVAPQSIAITSDGQLGFVALSDGNVVMLDIPGRQVVSTIFVGGTPHFIITGPYPPLIGSTPQKASISGQLDGPTLFSLVMITLVEMGAVFWVGAQLWLNFVLLPSGEKHPEEETTNQQVQQRFERRFSLPTLLLILLANVGVLVGQALNVTGGQLGAALAPQLLFGLVSNGRFGSYWLMREGVLILAIALALYILLFKKRSSVVNTVLSWANLLLGLALFIAITMSGHAAAVSGNVVAFALMVDWLHLLAAAFWVGGMMYIAAIYLPVLSHNPVAERARSLTTILPHYSPWALAGAGLMAVTGPFSATFHLTLWDQLITTAYGRALVVKIVLVAGLLITSAIHVGLLRPHVAKEYKKYMYAAARLQATQTTLASIALPTTEVTSEQSATTKVIVRQVKLRQDRLAKRTQRLMQVLRWEPLLGVAVLTCVGLMNVFVSYSTVTDFARFLG